MRRLRSLPAAALAWALGACGPSTAISLDPSASSTTGPETTSSSSSSTTGAPTDPPTGTSSTSSPSTTDGPQCSPLGSSCEDGTPCCEGACNGSFCEDDGFDSCGFLCPPDGGCYSQLPDGTLAHCSVECDVWAQDCPAGEKCTAWANDGGNSWNATKCSPVDPSPGQPGDPCTVEGNGVSGVDDCDVGSMCWNVDAETNMGICVAFCEGNEADPSCAEPGHSCMVANDGVLILCLPDCHPLLQDCGEDEVCIQTTGGDAFVCVLDASEDAGVAGDPCEYVNVCDPGLFCANADSVEGCAGSLGCCAPFCDLDDPNASTDCPGDTEECVPWYEAGAEIPGYETVGACVIPE